MKTISTLLKEESDYEKASTFENVEGIDISLTPGRKKLKIKIGDSNIELDKDSAKEISNAINVALSRM